MEVLQNMEPRHIDALFVGQPIGWKVKFELRLNKWRTDNISSKMVSNTQIRDRSENISVSSKSSVLFEPDTASKSVKHLNL